MRDEEPGRLGSVIRLTLLNVGIIALLSLALTLGFGYFTESQAGRTQGALGRSLFAWSIIFGSVLPGVLIYLLALGFLPASWGTGKRRLWAVLLSPLVGGLLWVSLFEPDTEVLGALATILAFCTLVGLLVRLPQRSS